MRYLYDVSAHGERPRTRPPRSARPRRVEPAIEDLGAVERKPRSMEEVPSSFGKRGWVILLAVLAIALTAGGFLVNAATTRSNRTAAVSSRSAARNAVIFVVDGAGPNDFSSRHLPTIHRLMRSGMVYQNAWTGEPTLSSAESNATLSTGVFPRENGIVGSEWQDVASTQPAGILRPSQVMIGSIDQALEASNVSPLAETLKNSQPRSRILSIGGEGCASASAAGTWVADYVLCPVRSGQYWVPGSVAGHELPARLASVSGWKVRAITVGGLGPALEGWSPGMQDHWIAKYASWVMNQIRPRITIINFPEIET